VRHEGVELRARLQPQRCPAHLSSNVYSFNYLLILYWLSTAAHGPALSFLSLSACAQA
jgi:hypothetical protein